MSRRGFRAAMDTRKRSGKTPCKREGCETGREATYRDLLSDRYASKALCTECGQAAKKRGELVAGQTMWRKAVKRCGSKEAARDELIKRMRETSTAGQNLAGGSEAMTQAAT